MEEYVVLFNTFVSTRQDQVNLLKMESFMYSHKTIIRVVWMDDDMKCRKILSQSLSTEKVRKKES
jgi:hypothetical protein